MVPPSMVTVVVVWRGVEGFETLAFGLGTSLLLSFDPSLFLFTGPAVVTGYVHRGVSVVVTVADSPLSLSPISLWRSVVVAGLKGRE